MWLYFDDFSNLLTMTTVQSLILVRNCDFVMCLCIKLSISEEGWINRKLSSILHSTWMAVCTLNFQLDFTLQHCVQCTFHALRVEIYASLVVSSHHHSARWRTPACRRNCRHLVEKAEPTIGALLLQCKLPPTAMQFTAMFTPNLPAHACKPPLTALFCNSVISDEDILCLRQLDTQLG